jgi:hypothetical protein
LKFSTKLYPFIIAPCVLYFPLISPFLVSSPQ